MGYRGVLEDVPDFGQSLARNLGAGVSQGFNQALNFAQQMGLEKQKGLYSAKLSKQLEKEQSLATGLETIKEMRNLISSAGPSNLIQSFLGIGDARQNRAQLESLGRSLIPLVAAGVPIRNQREFDEYRKVITNPNARQDDLEGALTGIESILERSIHSEIGRGEKGSSKKSETLEKFDLSNPKHKARRDEVLKKTKNDREKAEKVLMKEFEL